MCKLYFKWTAVAMTMNCAVAPVISILFSWFIKKNLNVESFYRPVLHMYVNFKWKLSSFFNPKKSFFFGKHLAYLGIKQHSWDILVTWALQHWLDLVICLWMVHFCCSSYRYASIIMHFTKCINARSMNADMMEIIAIESCSAI